MDFGQDQWADPFRDAQPEQSSGDARSQSPAGNAVPEPFADPADERRAIWAALASVDRTQRQMGAAFEAITQQLLALNTAAQPPVPQPATAPVPPPVPTPAAVRGTPRFKEPFVFGGSAAEVEPWIDEISNAVYLQRATLPDDYDRAIYLAGYLKQGSPKSWYYGIKSSNPDLLYDFDALLANFRAHFGDSDVSATALRKLKDLKQTGACSTYASKTRELHQHLNLNDFTKSDYFYNGLKEGVKDLLVNIKRANTFDAFVEQCIEFDNRLHNREVEKKLTSKSSSSRSSDRQDSRPRVSTAPVPVPAAAPAVSSAVPMEIDAVKRGPITADEKARRRREGLCFYCGQGKHRIEDCPNMSAKAKASYKARATASPSGKA